MYYCIDVLVKNKQTNKQTNKWMHSGCIARKERGRKGKEKREGKKSFFWLCTLANNTIERFCPKTFLKSSPGSPNGIFGKG